MQSRMNVALKTAIIASRKKQKRVAKLARLSESRLSKIVHGEPASETERAALSAVLGCAETEIFPDVPAAGEAIAS
jgi:transcriptional regulator with XRE-family HTH domain